MKQVFHAVKFHTLGILVFIVIQYHYDTDMIVIDRVSVHPIDSIGDVYENILENKDTVSAEAYRESLELLATAGIV